MEEKVNPEVLSKVSRDFDKITRESREKIVSKMDVSKFFAGFISLLTGILLGDGRMNSDWSRVGVILFLGSLGFCIAALSAYDHLLWPKEYFIKTYWPELSSERNWEELFQEKLESQLLYSWRLLFVPALMCFGVGFALLLVQELGPTLLPDYLGPKGPYVLFILLTMIFGAPTTVLFVKWHGDKKRAKRWAHSASGKDQS
jgi:hypothetical protein